MQSKALEFRDILANPADGVYADISRFIPDDDFCIHDYDKIFLKFFNKGTEGSVFVIWFENSTKIFSLKVLNPINPLHNEAKQTPLEKCVTEYQNLQAFYSLGIPVPKPLGIVKFQANKSIKINSIHQFHELQMEPVLCKHEALSLTNIDEKNSEKFEFYGIIKQFIPGKPLNQIFKENNPTLSYHYKQKVNYFVETLNKNGFHLRDKYPGNFIVSPNNFPFLGDLFLIDCYSVTKFGSEDLEL